jgi:hypothetical protein
MRGQSSRDIRLAAFDEFPWKISSVQRSPKLAILEKDDYMDTVYSSIRLFAKILFREHSTTHV